MNFRHKKFLNELALKRNPDLCVLGLLCRPEFTEAPDVVYLACGYPNPLVFPFEKASVTLKNGKTLQLDEQMMSTALQYGNVQGFEPLIGQMQTIVEMFHGVTNWNENDVVITIGGTDALYQSLEMLLDESTVLLAEQPLFGTVGQCIDTFGCKYSGIEIDDFGVEPSALREVVLQHINSTEKDIKMVLYFNYISVRRDQNHELLQRLKKIYEIAQEFNIFIVEVDPYFFLHIHKDEKNFASLLRLDTEGRVLRCDTTSSVFGPGWRIGFVTGPKFLIQLISSHIDMSMLSASMVSQVIISETLKTLTENELKAYSRIIFENLQDEQRDLKSAANLYLDTFEWKIYPEIPYLSFKIENLKVLSKIQNDFEKFSLALSLPSSGSKDTHLGISLLGTTAQEKQKVCKMISEMKN